MALRVPPPHPLADSIELREVTGRRGHTDTYRLSRALIFVLLATTLDVANFLDRGNSVRYLLLLVPIAALVLIRLQTPTSFVRRPAPADLILLLLWPIGLTGTLIAMLFHGATATSLSVFLPMTLAFLYLGVVESPTDRETRSLLRAIAWVGSLYIILNALVNAGLIPGLAANQYRNASLLFMALGLAATVILRRWVWLAILIALEAYCFKTYPSGTSILVFIAILLTFSMTEPRPTRLRPYIIVTLIGCAVTIVLLNFATGVAITNEYFSLVGKNNANSTRLQAWGDGINEFKESPLVGNGFTDAGITTVTRPGGRGTFQIPFHNDYILFLAKGGLVGLGLLVGFIVTTELAVLRRYGELIVTGQNTQAALLRALLVGFNVFFVTSAFNPAISGMSRSASLFAVYALMMLVGSPRPVRQPA